MILDRTPIGRHARLFPGGVHTFELPELMRALREEPGYIRAGRDGVTLVKTPELRVVLEVLGAGTVLAEHRAPGPMTLHLMQGQLRFRAGDEVLYLQPGELLAIPDRGPHSVEAVTDSAFLLTLATPAPEAQEQAG
jgi:quercetin dioxygenase-like cupin family protein